MYDQPAGGGGQPPSLPERGKNQKTFWENVEGKYYAFCDTLQDHGIPVYDFFVYPLEDRGIPSLPAAVIIILALLLGIGWLALGGLSLEPSSYSLKASVYGESGPIDGAVLTLSQDGSVISKTKSNEGGSASFDALAKGEYSLEVEKENFEKAILAISIPRDSNLDITLISSQKIAFQGKQPSGKKTESGNFSEIDYSDLSLKIFVTDIAGNPLDASANIFDKNSGNKLGTVAVTNGFGSFDGLEEGMVVYADIAAEGHVPYFGKNNATTISAESPNSISVKLFKITNDTESRTTLVKVKDLNGTPLNQVLIKVFKRGSPFALTIPNEYTNSSGELALSLNSTGNPDYKILALKGGYVDAESSWFKAGSKVEITLKKESELNQSEKDHASNLTVTVTFNGSVVSNAAVSVFHDDLATREGFTNSRGKISFYILNSRGLTVTVNASKNNLLASQQVPLTSEQVQATLELERRKARVTVKAFNYSSGGVIEDAVFEAKAGGATLASCSVAPPNYDCVLQIGIGLVAEINASAPTFVSEIKSLTVNNETMRLEFSLIPEYAVQSSQIKDFVVTLEGGNSNVTTLYPGKRYEAKFTLIGKTNSTSDEFGFYFGVDPARAIIKRVTPPSISNKTLGSTTAACNPQQIDYNNANAAWVDLTYAGSNSVSSKSVKVVFEIKPLGQGVQESNLTLRYRSFLVQLGKYYRNPLNVNDPPETRFEPKSPLASGCNSPTINQLYAINGIGISCSEYACVSVLFTQNGQQSAKDNFTMRNFGEGSTPAVVMAYEVTLKKNVANNPSPISFSFDAPGGFIGLTRVSYPDAPDEQGTPPQPPNKVVFLTGTPSSYSIDLSYLKDYSNMDVGFKFNGDFVIKPLSSSNVSGQQLSLELNQGVDGVTHSATYNIQANGSSGGGGGNEQIENSAKLNMQLRERKENGNYIADPLLLYAIGLCSYESILNTFFQIGLPKCAGSFVELSYTATVNDTQNGRGWVFFNSTANGITLIQNLSISKQRGQGISFVQGLENNLYNGFFNISLNDVVAGDIVNVSLLGITSEAPKFSNFKFIFDNGKANWFSNRTKLNALPNSGGPPASFDYFPCGKAAITLDIPLGGQGEFTVNSSCNEAILQVDPIMPLDAIPMEFTQSFKNNCGTFRLNRFFSPTDGSRDLSQKIEFDYSEYPQKPAWIAFNAFTAGLLKGNKLETDPRFPGLDYLGKATLRVDCSRLPSKFVDIRLTARAADSRIPAIDGSYIYYQGMPHQLVYSLYNGQLPRDLLISPSNETTTVKTRVRNFDASSRVNYFLINHRSTPVGITIKDTPPEEGINITQFNNRFGSVYSHMVAISHLDLITLGKYLHFLDTVQQYPPSQQHAIWNSTCPSIDYVSEVTHQIPRNFVEEAKRISLITGFRRSPPQNGYWCGHREDKPPGERTCYPSILNWMHPGIKETKEIVACPAPACLQASETDPDAYTPDAITLSVNPQNAFPPEGQPYGYNVSTDLELSAGVSGLPAGTNVTAAAVEFKSKERQDCPIQGGNWCSTTFLNDGVAMQFNQTAGLWKIAYAGMTNAQNGEYIVRVKAANETGGVFYYSPWARIMVGNNAAACFNINTQRQNVPLCAEPVCDLFCGPDGTKEIITSAGPDLQDVNSWWLNDTQLEFVPAAQIEGIERYPGMPFKYFKQKGVIQNDFSLSSPLMQWNWNIDDIANAGFAIENDAKCVEGTGFYELKASSPDAGNWSFKVALKKLPLSGYLLNTEPSDSDRARGGYIDDLPPNPRTDVFAKRQGCGIGTDPGYQDVKYLCNAKNLIVEEHSHYANENPQILDCFIPCKYNNCGYCINFNLPFEQYEWNSCLAPVNRGEFSSLQSLRQASTDPNSWAYGVGRELGGCPNEATRISD